MNNNDRFSSEVGTFSSMIYLNEIREKMAEFTKISLKEMEGVKLMDRVDVKYLIPLYLLPNVLEEAKAHYRILEINQERLLPYETLYYDTENLMLYHTHQAGKKSRYKIRSRNYVGSNLSFFEVKYKNNKGRTIKTRIKQDSEIEKHLNEQNTLFLSQETPLNPDELKGNIWVNYHRMTLVSRTSAERLTINLNLQFLNDTKAVGYPQIAIAEVKQEKIGASPIIDIFRKNQLSEGSISKYCLGIISIDERVKHNRFKPKLIHFNKIINQYESFIKTNSFSHA